MSYNAKLEESTARRLGRVRGIIGEGRLSIAIDRMLDKNFPTMIVHEVEFEESLAEGLMQRSMEMGVSDRDFKTLMIYYKSDVYQEADSSDRFILETKFTKEGDMLLVTDEIKRKDWNYIQANMDIIKSQTPAILNVFSKGDED